ncbi:MAG: peptide chain release factor 3, partial [Terrisporobacter sp.]|uniref:EF-Tu/IF-2/RF-3 family GTPase n=1 Tax=Terrisporobacter sp. TaxID=1965305 RepID=UPI002FCBD7AB
GIRSCPVNWPIGSGKEFKGVFNRHKNKVEVFNDGNHGQAIANSITGDPSDEKFNELLGDALHEKLLEDIELLDIAGDDFDLDGILNGELSPVFFGSALTNFGVEPFLESFLEITAPPSPRSSNLGEIDPISNNFSGFIFKIQANMDKNHRDRIAFLRICSGEFEKGMTVNHVQRNKKVKLSQPQQFVAQDRVIIDKAYPGDIIGIHDPGIFNIGDTLSEKQSNLEYTGIPQFAPEHFMRVSTKNALKRKQFVKGLTQLSEEGAIQIYKQPNWGMEELIVGVVGVLQFEVLEYRLKQEYGVDILMNPLPYCHVRWIENDLSKFGKLSMPMDTLLVEDKDRNPAVLFGNEWSIRTLTERNEGIALRETSL